MTATQSSRVGVPANAWKEAAEGGVPTTAWPVGPTLKDGWVQNSAYSLPALFFCNGGHRAVNESITLKMRLEILTLRSSLGIYCSFIAS